MSMDCATTYFIPASKPKRQSSKISSHPTLQYASSRNIHERRPKLLYSPSKSSRNVVGIPIHLNLSRVHVLIDVDRTIVDIVVLLLALFEYLEYEVTADSQVVSVAKVLVNALFEGLNALADFFLVE